MFKLQRIPNANADKIYSDTENIFTILLVSIIELFFDYAEQRETYTIYKIKLVHYPSSRMSVYVSMYQHILHC